MCTHINAVTQGKKRMKRVGNVALSQVTLWS
jgi:hypothetical protein